ncbi:MAG: hypothetical protein ACI4D9_05075 [Lachnospiraceae bacterium]
MNSTWQVVNDGGKVKKSDFRVLEYKRRSFSEHFPLEKIQIKEMTFSIEGVVTAMYCALTDKLKIADDWSDEVFFGSVIHEFYHAYQRHTKGLVKYLLIKTFQRKVFEAPAKQAELCATQWCGDQRIKQWKEKHKYEQHSNT